MNKVHFSITTLMAVVLVLAVNLAAGGPFYGPTGMEWASLLNSGALPMASILAVGLVALTRRRPSRAGGRFLAGFEVFGTAALFLYIACARLFAQAIHQDVGDLLKRVVSPGRPLFSWSFMAIVLLPQLLLAMLGGWLNQRYRIERRRAEDPEPS